MAFVFATIDSGDLVIEIDHIEAFRCTARVVDPEAKERLDAFLAERGIEHLATSSSVDFPDEYGAAVEAVENLLPREV